MRCSTARSSMSNEGSSTVQKGISRIYSSSGLGYCGVQSGLNLPRLQRDRIPVPNVWDILAMSCLHILAEITLHFPDVITESWEVFNFSYKIWKLIRKTTCHDHDGGIWICGQTHWLYEPLLLSLSVMPWAIKHYQLLSKGNSARRAQVSRVLLTLEQGWLLFNIGRAHLFWTALHLCTDIRCVLTVFIVRQSEGVLQIFKL